MDPTTRTTRSQVPEGAFSGDVPLVAVRRGGYVSSVHRGVAAVVSPDGKVVAAVGDTRQPVFLRSAAKPFQVMPALLAGAVERYAITERELSVLCASHNAEPIHTETILTILARVGLSERALHCGTHPPIHVATAQSLVRSGTEPTPVCNNCSGAHTGMLLACLANGWDQDTYGKPDHPLQRETLLVLSAFADIPASEIEFGIDNCHVPAFRMPVHHAALAFARLASSEGVTASLGTAAEMVRNAMMHHPEMVGGEDRFDTDLMRAAHGKIVMKGGADGFQGLGLIDAGLGLALKISDGAALAVSPAVLRLLDSTGYLDAGTREAVRNYVETVQFDHTGDQIGSIAAVFRMDDGV